MDVLINERYKQFDKLSRYVNCPYYYNTLDNKYEVALPNHLKESLDYVVHKVKVRDTYDSIALDYYNNPTYFWVIMDFNKIQDAFSNPEPGTYLKIPVISNIEFE